MNEQSTVRTAVLRYIAYIDKQFFEVIKLHSLCWKLRTRPTHGFRQMSKNHEGAAHVPEECHE